MAFISDGSPMQRVAATCAVSGTEHMCYDETVFDAAALQKHKSVCRVFVDCLPIVCGLPVDRLSIVCRW